MEWRGRLRGILSKILHLLLELRNLLLLLKFAFYAADRSCSSLYNLLTYGHVQILLLKEKKNVRAVILKAFDCLIFLL